MSTKSDHVARRLRREKWLLSFLLPAVACCTLGGFYKFMITGDARWLLLCLSLLVFTGK